MIGPTTERGQHDHPSLRDRRACGVRLLSLSARMYTMEAMAITISRRGARAYVFRSMLERFSGEILLVCHVTSRDHQRMPMTRRKDWSVYTFTRNKPSSLRGTSNLNPRTLIELISRALPISDLPRR